MCNTLAAESALCLVHILSSVILIPHGAARSRQFQLDHTSHKCMQQPIFTNRNSNIIDTDKARNRLKLLSNTYTSNSRGEAKRILVRIGVDKQDKPCEAFPTHVARNNLPVLADTLSEALKLPNTRLSTCHGGQDGQKSTR